MPDQQNIMLEIKGHIAGQRKKKKKTPHVKGSRTVQYKQHL